MQIIPSIIGKDFDEVRAKIELVAPFVNWAQLDLVDGIFSWQVTWPYDPASIRSAQAKAGKQGVVGLASHQLRFLRDHFPNLKMELHLMTDKPEKEIDSWIEAGPQRILIHLESSSKIGEILNKIKNAGISSGIALKLDSPAEAAFPYSDKIEMIQLMGIKEIGAYGQAFAPEVLEKIKTIKKNYPELLVQVDGGINLETGKQVLEAGADNIIAGSAIFKAVSIEKAVQDFKNLAV